ncbi:MAG: vWA domain-containing protein, partial [Longimicrobiales bacterium]
MNTQLYLDQEPSSDGSTLIVRALLRLTADAPSEDRRRPLNLSLVLDRSGSMSGPKLDAAKQAAVALARRLGPRDLLSVVGYGSDVRTEAEPGTGEQQEDLVARIEAIVCDGMTNLSGGWLRGRELVARNAGEDRISRVILLTDGLANEGITDADRLAALCRGAAEDGITTATVGFGEGFNEHLLTLMADAGGGGTYYIEEPDQAVAVFGAELDGLLTVAAQNTAVEILPAAAVELAAVHHAYPRRAIDGGLRLELGDLYAREPKALLAQFLVPTGSLTGDVAIADVVVHAHVLGEDGSVERREVRLPITIDAAGEARVSAEVRRELLRL